MFVLVALRLYDTLSGVGIGTQGHSLSGRSNSSIVAVSAATRNAWQTRLMSKATEILSDLPLMCMPGRCVVVRIRASRCLADALANKKDITRFAIVRRVDFEDSLSRFLGTLSAQNPAGFVTLALEGKLWTWQPCKHLYTSTAKMRILVRSVQLSSPAVLPCSTKHLPALTRLPRPWDAADLLA